MAVLPAPFHVDLEKLQGLIGTEETLGVARESEFESLFPTSETGAMAPFGNLYDVKVCADTILEEDEEIFFNAGTHTEVIGMQFADWKRLVKPIMGEFRKRVD
jgi:Ala-tRNA(Pro) deacylase